MSTTYEEATRCPKCEKPGSVRKKTTVRKGRRTVEQHLVYCETELCPWFNTAWIIQVNEDGSIPEAYSQVGPKQYPKLSPESETRVQEAMEAQLAAETRPGGEVRNPRG